MKTTNNKVPKSLRIWFVIHFVIDLIFAIPLIIFPTKFLTFLGWTTIDNFSARLVGAALLGIGGISLLKNKAGLETYHALLTLKIIWSLTALLGILLTMLEKPTKIGWLIYGIFAIFSLVWINYKISLPKK